MTSAPQWMDYLRVVFALAFIAGLIFFSGYLVKRLGLDKRITGNKGPARLHLVETLYLDPKRRVVVLRCDEREHLLLLSAGGDVLIQSRNAGGADAG